MSLTMNMVGGGGSGIPGNRAVLVARIPSGSTVTASKGGVTLTPMMWVSETYPDQDIALFVFTPAQFDSTTPWTITATDGTRTKSDTVLITTNKEYEITLAYELILVQNGIVPSGVSLANNVSYANPNALLTVTQGTGYTRLNTNNGWQSVWSTTDKIDVSPYTIMTIRFVAQNLTSSPPAALRGAGIGVMAAYFKGNNDTPGLANAITAYANTETSSANIQTLTLNISSYSEMYLVVICSAWANTNAQVDVYDWKLE